MKTSSNGVLFYLFKSVAPTHLTQLAASCLDSIKVGLNHTLKRSPFGGHAESRWACCKLHVVAQQQIRAAQYIFTFPGNSMLRIRNVCQMLQHLR